MHLGQGAPKLHTEASHPHPEHPRVKSLTREMMVENTKVIRRENDKQRLYIYEALLIQ